MVYGALLSLFVFIFGDGRWGQAAQPLQGSQFCLQPGCHSASKWLDNDPPSTDVTAHNAFLEYPPLNLSPSPGISPFDKISDAYLGSIHNIPSFNTSITDEVMCVGCHISMGSAHSGGVGTLPDTKTCGKCHNSITGGRTSITGGRT